MRLWSIHPCYLDPKGLLALWREGLLAQKVLKGKTKGYRQHSQLTRFKNCSSPIAAISTYLKHIHDEASRWRYKFDETKIERRRIRTLIPLTRGQLDYELYHLRIKMKKRDPVSFKKLKPLTTPKSHPLFCVRAGTVETWKVHGYPLAEDI
jgi:hypothetical protein